MRAAKNAIIMKKEMQENPEMNRWKPHGTIAVSPLE